jgi:hypothetical protein
MQNNYCAPEGLLEEFENLYPRRCLFCGINLNLYKWKFGNWDYPDFYFWGCPNYFNKEIKCYYKINIAFREKKELVKLIEKYHIAGK